MRARDETLAIGPSPGEAVEWVVEAGLVPYPAAIATMERRVAEIASGSAAEQVWLVEHPPLLTAGTSARAIDLLQPDALPVFASGRGGQYTYHGPGQRVAYVMVDLRRRRLSLRDYISALETWIVRVLATLGLEAERRPDRVGVWVQTLAGEAKIGAVGVRVRHGVTFHGIALNVDPDLSHYTAIVPCGVRGFGVTSLRALGSTATMGDVDAALRGEFRRTFGAAVAGD